MRNSQTKKYFFVKLFFLTLSGLTLWNTSPGLGGADLPPLNYGYRRMFSLFSFSQGSFLGCKGSESKSTAIYLKKYSPESFWKNRHFWQNLKRRKKIARLNIGAKCSKFLLVSRLPTCILTYLLYKTYIGTGHIFQAFGVALQCMKISSN